MAIGKHLTDLNPDGSSIGQSTADKIGFYGLSTPIAQRTNSSQATSLLSTASSTAIDTLTKAAIIEIMNFLQAINLWKGS